MGVIPLAEIEAAVQRLGDSVLRTPLVPLPSEPQDPPGVEIYLKLENLQPIGSFKLRGAGNALRLAAEHHPERLERGVYTASAGNMAQGVAWNARRMGLECRVIVPDHAPRTKVQAIRRLGGKVVTVPFAEWWQVLVEHRFPGEEGYFLHPVSHPAVVAGNGTVGLEIAEQCPEVAAVLVPYGGGGLSSGIACALRERLPGVQVFGCEVATAAPLAAAWQAGEPVEVEYTPSFVDGVGSSRVLDEMWPLVRSVLAGPRVASLAAVAAAVRRLVERNRVVPEGAGATSVAAALTPAPEQLPEGKVVCVISGGNIDREKLAQLLQGEIPP